MVEIKTKNWLVGRVTQQSEVAESDRAAAAATAEEASGLAGSPKRGRFSLLRFRRVTSSGRFIPEIDGLRFIAILVVYLYHLSGYVLEKDGIFTGNPGAGAVARIMSHGHYGVQLFFVISGFILAMPFASHYLIGSKPVSLRSYFLRRLTRLEPPYVISMLLFAVLMIVYVGVNASYVWPRLAASLLYIHNFVYGGGSAINPVAWSLEVEIQFYILVPLLARLFAIQDLRVRRTTIVALIVIALAMQAFVMPDTLRFTRSILNNIQFFLCGFLLAEVYLLEWRSAPGLSPQWDIVSLIGWPSLLLVWEYPHLSRWLFPPMALCLYFAAFRGRWSRAFFANPWIMTIGGMCYTIYLLHYQIISFVGRFSLRFKSSEAFAAELLWQFLLITPVVLAICGVYYALIERPCMRPDWPRRLMNKVRTVARGEYQEA
jgi:peptidoglycan/LPS O-acetylase OafA/YrhL